LTDDVIAKNTTIQALRSTSTKPSFLLWDRVYQKLTDDEDQEWLLRASEVAMVFLKDVSLKNEQLRFVIRLYD
jgi:hypothetical protein